MGEGNPVGVGYTKVEVVGVCNWVVHEWGLMGLNPKTKPLELSFGDCNVGGCDMGGWNPVGVGYTIEVVGVCNWAPHKGGG